MIEVTAGTAARQASAHVRQVLAFIKHTRRACAVRVSIIHWLYFLFFPSINARPPPTATVPVSEVRICTKIRLIVINPLYLSIKVIDKLNKNK